MTTFWTAVTARMACISRGRSFAASIEAVKVMNPPYRFPGGAGAALIIETDGDSEQGTLEALAMCLDVASEPHEAAEDLGLPGGLIGACATKGGGPVC